MKITSSSVNKFNPEISDLGINLDFFKKLSRQICDQREFLGICEGEFWPDEFTTQNFVDNDECLATTFDQWLGKICLWQRQGR